MSVLVRLKEMKCTLLEMSREMPPCQFILTPEDYTALLKESAAFIMPIGEIGAPTILGIPFAVFPGRTFLRVL